MNLFNAEVVTNIICVSILKRLSSHYAITSTLDNKNKTNSDDVLRLISSLI